uniref:cGMP-dependent protein kinase interacting domain-containing protein n=1 Tax=Ciona savignyi TaxID=51511 RepID=H2Z5B4_CIOSA
DTEDGGDEGNSLTPGGQSPSARKSAAQQRRRQRKERRSTGLPGLKPSSTADNGSDDDETFKNDIDADDTKADRLKTTAARYDSSSLPDRHSRHRSGGLRGSDNDLPSRFAAPLDDRKTDEKDYKKLFEDSRDDNERLQRELEDAKRRVAELESRLERADDVSARRKAAETEKRALERKLAEAEKELMVLADIRSDNQRLKDENGALIRVISKLSK